MSRSVNSNGQMAKRQTPKQLHPTDPLPTESSSKHSEQTE